MNDSVYHISRMLIKVHVLSGYLSRIPPLAIPLFIYEAPPPPKFEFKLPKKWGRGDDVGGHGTREAFFRAEIRNFVKNERVGAFYRKGGRGILETNPCFLHSNKVYIFSIKLAYSYNINISKFMWSIYFQSLPIQDIWWKFKKKCFKSCIQDRHNANLFRKCTFFFSSRTKRWCPRGPKGSGWT